MTEYKDVRRPTTATLHGNGFTEHYATMADAEERAAFLRPLGYVVWLESK